MFIDDRHFLFTRQAGRADITGIYLATLGLATETRVSPQYSNTAFANGTMIYVADGMIVSQSLDLENHRLTGDPVEVAGPAAFSGGLGFESFSIASNGALTYAPGSGTAVTSEFRWLDRHDPASPPAPLASRSEISQYTSYCEQFSPDGQT